jgi:hypothetical protein
MMMIGGTVRKGNGARFPQLLLWTAAFLCCLPLLVDSVQVVPVVADNGNGIDDMRRVVIGFSSAEEQAAFKARMVEDRSSTASRGIVSFDRANAVALTLSSAELEALQQQQQSNFAYVEPDMPMRTYQTTIPGREVIPYGAAAVLQAETAQDVYDNIIPLPPPVTTSPDSDDCFRVCVIDTGLLVDHIDIPFERTEEGFRLNGAEFGIPNGQFWYNPNPSTSNHGTHVTVSTSIHPSIRRACHYLWSRLLYYFSTDSTSC